MDFWLKHSFILALISTFFYRHICECSSNKPIILAHKAISRHAPCCHLQTPARDNEMKLSTGIVTPLAFLLISQGALAAPRPQGDMSSPGNEGCLGHRPATYRNLNAENYTPPPQLATGATCKSGLTAGCEIAKGVTFEK